MIFEFVRNGSKLVTRDLDDVQDRSISHFPLSCTASVSLKKFYNPDLFLL